MDKTLQGILIAAIIVAILLYAFRTPKATTTTPPADNPPPRPVDPNQQLRIINIITPPSNWNTLVVGRNYRWGGRYLRGYNNVPCAQTIQDSTGGTGTFIGQGTNSCWYVFSTQPSGVTNPPPPPQDPVTQMRGGGSIGSIGGGIGVSGGSRPSSITQVHRNIGYVPSADQVSVLCKGGTFDGQWNWPSECIRGGGTY